MADQSDVSTANAGHPANDSDDASPNVYAATEASAGGYQSGGEIEQAAVAPGLGTPGDAAGQSSEQDGCVGTVPPAEAIRECIASAENRIIQMFEKKLAFDQFKEQQIERLHGELQEYKRGLVDSILLPLVKQIVRYVDQLPRHVASLRKKPEDQLGPERLFLELEGVREDLELILENVGVTIFRNPAMEFDAKVQQARSTEPIGNAAKHGQIVERLLPGYEMNGRVIEKERVKVFVYQEGRPLTSEQAAEGEAK
jgi:molecular chaperone GrpE (heat shock protein)